MLAPGDVTDKKRTGYSKLAFDDFDEIEKHMYFLDKCSMFHTLPFVAQCHLLGAPQARKCFWGLGLQFGIIFL